MSHLDPRVDLRGIVASLHTPFAEDDTVDAASLARLVDHCARSSCCGVLVAAVAGEAGALAAHERRRMLEVVAEAAAGRLGIVAGVSAPDLAASAALARDAAAGGAAMVLWQPPPGMDQDALEAGLTTLAEAGPGQIMLQDLDWDGPGLAPEAIARLAERVPALAAVKIETAPAGPKYSAVRRAAGGRLHLSGGWAAMQMLDGLARGLDAFMPSGLLPVYVRIFELWSAGRHDAARALFERALPILAFSNQHIDVSIRFWKHVRQRQGIFDGERCRPPVRALDPVHQDEAERLARRAIELEAELG
ncbi:MAG TPA: dihydrodipicolinate synthase family protein [Geminicoccaceae bacterium]|nr:dihydrodipicolinate synthase family protein [Geminicoccaceae bacterium]